MARAPSYPFEPRSNAFLRPGQFWAVPLSDGRYACGRVLAVPEKTDDGQAQGDRRGFLAGLMDWCGEDEPTAEGLAGSGLLDQGRAHVRAIQYTGRLILGCRSLEEDGIIGLRCLDHRGPGTAYLYEGATRRRPATEEERRSLPVVGAWKPRTIVSLAEAAFVKRSNISASGRRTIEALNAMEDTLRCQRPD